MRYSAADPDLIFDAKARLQLLQPEARRPMAERLAKKAGTKAAANAAAEEETDDEDDADEMPPAGESGA
jgi:hypothetical protein